MTALYTLGALGALFLATLAVVARRAWVAQAALGGVFTSLAALALLRSAGPLALALALSGMGIIALALATGDGSRAIAPQWLRGAAWILGGATLLALLAALLAPTTHLAAPGHTWRDLAETLLGRYGRAAIGVTLLGLAAVIGSHRREED